MNNVGLAAHRLGGLPDRVSQQRPLVPGVRCSRRPRTDFHAGDNGSAYTSHAYRRALAERGLRHLRIQPYPPRTNGKVCV